MSKNPSEATEQIPGKVFACLLPGEMRIHLWPGLGIAAGTYRDVPIDLIPAELRIPSASVWVKLDDQMCNVIRVWKREVQSDDSRPFSPGTVQANRQIQCLRCIAWIILAAGLMIAMCGGLAFVFQETLAAYPQATKLLWIAALIWGVSSATYSYVAVMLYARTKRIRQDS